MSRKILWWWGGPEYLVVRQSVLREAIILKKIEFCEKKGGGSIGFHKTLFFSQNLKRPLFTVFCWQDPMNCASVGTKNLGNTGV